MTDMNKTYTFGSQFLDQIAEWIGDNLEPEQVFSEERLAAWAKENGWRLEEEPGENEQ